MKGFLNLFRKKTLPAKKQLVSTQSYQSSFVRPDIDDGNPEKKPKSEHNKPHDKRPIIPHWDISQFDVPPEDGKTRFHDFNLPASLMRAIQDQGFSYCTPIQAKVLGSTLKGQDAIGKAQTGTGKTAAFLIAAIKQLLETPPPTERYLGEPRVVVTAPTRELAIQICEDAKALTIYTDLHVVMVVGGMDYEKQRKHLNENFVDILIATPGRLLDYIQKHDIHLDIVETLILDEADRMLDMGFIPQMRRIVRATPRPGDRQTLLFSATFNDEVMRLAEQWTWNPVQIEIEPDRVATDNVEQKVYIVTTEQKYRILHNMIIHQKLDRVIVFTNRRDQTRRLSEKLQKDGINSDMLSGEVPQDKRIRTLNNFKRGKIQVLVATDVAGRGLHVDGISHVINYNLPEDPEDYVHRIGRTGRAGATGTSISFACENESFLLLPLEELLGYSLTKTSPPDELLSQ